jgi:hypothetical protein
MAESMRRPILLASSTLVAGAVALALFLRPTHSIAPGPELPVAERITPAVRAVIRSKMIRHSMQLRGLVERAVVLDYDGTARVAGEIFDEPMLARPLAGDELNSVLPSRFFDLQDDLRNQARALVTAAARRDGPRVAITFGALAKSCIECHDLYLHGASE